MYLATDDALRVWYIGIAQSLRDRISSHDRIDDFQTSWCNCDSLAFARSYCGLEIARKQLILKADAIACYRPANSQELFARRAHRALPAGIFRSYRLEAGLFTTALDYCLEGSGRTFRPVPPDMVGDGDIEITRAQNCNYGLGEGVGAMSIESDVWQLLIRCQVNADRQYRRAVEDYERVKRLRPEVPNRGCAENCVNVLRQQ